jgi:DNA excision repair protein ERCC-2
MSGTLTPPEVWCDALGLDPERSELLELPTPFPTARRRIMVAPGIATTFRERDRYHQQLADLLARVVAARSGHYVAFFPSFAYLRAVAGRLELSDAEMLEQTEQMSDAERALLLDRLRRSDGRTRLLLAVLGGIFAEGVDYPGESLVGAVVISPALPTVSPERELIRGYFDQRDGSGFSSAYVAPGMTRVVQAVGRLIRSEQDMGVAVLVGRRFRQRNYARFFPGDWQDSGADRVVHRDLERELKRFWDSLEDPAVDAARSD